MIEPTEAMHPADSTQDRAVLAIDIGGTKMAAALVGDDGTVLRADRTPTPRRGADEVFAALRDLIGRVRGQRRPLAAGIGCAGPLNGARGLVSPVNITVWRDYPLVERVRTVVGDVPVALGVDGHCFAVGEAWTGAGRGVDDLLGIVVSTGVGGGLVLGGREAPGRTGNAAHIGHMVVDQNGEACPCGSYGCVETYASGPRMVARARRFGWRPDQAGADAAVLAADAAAGDPVAQRVFDGGAQALAAGIVSTAVTADLTFVVVGGGVSKAGPVLFDPLDRWIKRLAQLPFVQGLTVHPAVLENAGLVGAAKLAWDSLD